MKSKMNDRINQLMVNLQTLEANCSESKKGFEPSTVVCMYLLECLLMASDIYPLKTLRVMSIETMFNDTDDLLKYLDETIARAKQVEYYELDKGSIERMTDQHTVSLYDFLINPDFNSMGQLNTFLQELLKRLTMLDDILNDKRRNKVKLSYLNRMFTIPINNIASLLEAMCAGLNTDVK